VTLYRMEPEGFIGLVNFAKERSNPCVRFLTARVFKSPETPKN